MSDSSQPNNAPSSFQDIFIKASTEREITLPVMSNDKQVDITIRRWTLTQQITLGNAFSNLFTAFAGLFPALAQGKDNTVDVSMTELVEVMSNTGDFLVKQKDNLFKVVAGSIAHNFDNDMSKSLAFVDTLDLSDCLQIIFVLARMNAIKETAKKKFQEIAEAFSPKKV